LAFSIFFLLFQPCVASFSTWYQITSAQRHLFIFSTCIYHWLYLDTLAFLLLMLTKLKRTVFNWWKGPVTLLFSSIISTIL
jgi:hypothetical protein